VTSCPDDALCDLGAATLVRLIASREVGCVEVMEAHLARIDATNDTLNAICTLTSDRALTRAREADTARSRGTTTGLLHGLPVAHKDLALTRGVRTTFGSPIFADYVPDMDSLIVERLRDAGAVSVGKTNTPEFGAGSQTFNPVFGATRNPYDTSRTAGGSSGGAAAALAAGMVPLADGSDMGGSLRNPAAFCNVVGLRPAPGRVPSWPTDLAWSTLGVEGPMARTVEDLALMLAAIAGPDARSPIAIDVPGHDFLGPLERDLRGTRIAFAPDFGGLMPIERAVRDVVAAAAGPLEAIGCTLETALPDFTDADEVFRTGRALLYAQKLGPLLDRDRDRLKPALVWNIECGRALTADDIVRAEVARTRLYHRVRTFMQRFDFLALPVTQVTPFPVSEEYPAEIAGTAMHTYLDWMRACSHVTVTGLPAISVPCGFTPDGLPVGLQIVGRHHGERDLLTLAHAFERATRHHERRPPLTPPRTTSQGVGT